MAGFSPDNLTLKAALRSNYRSIIYGLVSLIAVDLLGFTFPYLIKLSIDRMEGQPWPLWIPSMWRDLDVMPSLWVVAALFVCFAALTAYVRYWWRVFFIWSNFPIIHGMRVQFFAHLHQLSGDFFRSRKTGDIISALSNDTENMRMVLSIGALMAVDASLNFILYPLILWHLNAPLTLMVIPPLIAISGLAVIWSARLSGAYQRVQAITGDLSGKAFEIASGIRVIKAFRREAQFHQDFHLASSELRDSSLVVARFQSFFVPVMEFALAIAVMVVIGYGGWLVIQNRMLLSDFVAFNLYVKNLDWPLMAFGWFVQLYRSAQASEGRVQSLAKIEPEIKAQPNLRRIPYNTDFDFRIENLSLKWPEKGRKIFDSLNLQIPARTWVGLTGPVGSGKTLLLELLSRQRDPTQGTIFYRGEDLRTWDTTQLSQEVLYVPQETFLFSKSLRRNLLLGINEGISDDRLGELLSSLRFDMRVLEERGGLMTRLGEKGVNLSGGQRQRLALGRALLRKRSVYLFDDLFSHVDAETETALLKVLQSQISPDALVIFVSQRWATLASSCSHVLVLSESGQVEAFGEPTSILSQSPFLQKLLSLQSFEVSHG